MKSDNKGWSIAYWIVVLVMLAVGVVGWYWRLTTGHQMSNYGSIIPWGLWVAMYIYFIGLSAGAFLISSLVYVFGFEKFRPVARLSLFTALVALLMALLQIWVDLGHMGRFYEVYTRPHFLSMMAWMVWLYSAYFLLLLAEMWFDTRRDLVRWGQRSGFSGFINRLLALGSKDTGAAAAKQDAKVVRVLGTIGVFLAIAFHGGVGALFAVDKSRPMWHTGLYPLMFLLAALVSGGGLLLAIYAFFAPDRGSEQHKSLIESLSKLVLGLVLLYMLFTFADYSIVWYGAIPLDVNPLKTILAGPFWYVFWIGEFVLGMIVPIVLLGLKSTRRSSWWVGLAGLSIVIAFVAVRLNIVIPPLSVPELAGLAQAAPSPRMSTMYLPSVMEWFVTIGIVGVGAAIYALGYRLLPVKPQVSK